MLTLYSQEQDKLIETQDILIIKALLEDEEKNHFLCVTNPQLNEIDFLIHQLDLHLITIKNFDTSKHFPKLELHPNYVSTIMYDIELTDQDTCYKINPISIILMKNLTVVLSKTDFLSIHEILARITTNIPVNFSDACKLYYITLDVLVDNLFPILSCFEQKLDSIQETALQGYDKDYTKRLLILRSNLLKLNKCFAYEKEVLYQISHDKLDFIYQDDIAYMKDVYHHLEKLNATLKEFSDWTSTLSDAYANHTSSKVNDRLQLLTVIQYIFMPLSFLTGWYGMNFTMPETVPPVAYYIFIIIVTGLTTSMVLYFKKKKLL